MGTSRSCWNGRTSALEPEEITSKGTIISCVLSIKVPIRKNLETYLIILIPHGRWWSVWRKSLMVIAPECYGLYWTNPGSNTLRKQQLYGYLPPISKTIQIRRTRHVGQHAGPHAGEVRTNSLAMYSCRSLHTGEQGLGNKLKPIYNCSVLIQDIAWRSAGSDGW